jgi:orotate phosphoribosyltransferase
MNSYCLSNTRTELMEFIKKNGIVFEHVTLSSNIQTEYYYDVKKVALDPRGIDLLGTLLLREVSNYKAKSVGGLEMGAIPLATAVAMKSTKSPNKNKNGIHSFFIRKNPKTHGLEKKIEGKVVSPVVIVDDVLTSGNSIKDAIDSIKQTGVNVKGVVCVIDREEETPNVLKQHKIKYSSLFTHSDFKSFIEQKLKNKRQDQKT